MEIEGDSCDSCCNGLNYAFQYIEQKKNEAIVNYIKYSLEDSKQEIAKAVANILDTNGDLSESDIEEIRFLKRLKLYLTKKAENDMLRSTYSLPEDLCDEIHEYLCEYEPKHPIEEYYKVKDPDEDVNEK